MILNKAEAEKFISKNYNLALKCTSIYEFDNTREIYVDADLKNKEIAFSGKYNLFTLLGPDSIEYVLVSYSDSFTGKDELLQEIINNDPRDYKGYVFVEPKNQTSNTELFKIEPYYIQGVASY